MGSGDGKHLLNFHGLHLPHLHGRPKEGGSGRVEVPKGCLAVMVGQEGEELQRFVIPVLYFNHPLFMQLLKEAEKEYGFDQKGPINIPCHVAHFRYVQAIIDRDTSPHGRHHHHHHYHNHQHHHHHQLLPCFRA